jgi:hypothetical protein
VDAGRSPEHPAPQGRPGLFLVELRGSSPGSGDEEDMSAALRLAVTRLRAAGTPIRWCGAWLVPADRRCLCVVEAADGTAVALARDTAALGAASVRPVQPLPDRASPTRTPGSRGRS